MTDFLPFSLSVPATTANLGPGFDCLGAALSLYNRFHFSPCTEEIRIIVKGKESQGVITDKNNLLYQSFLIFYQKTAQTPPNISVEIELGVPLARGLGSSATAIVGGLVGANHIAGYALSQEEILGLGIALEGHPDNIVPAFMGNCQLCVGAAGNWQICSIPWHHEIIPVVAIPDFELSTEKARAVLPKQYSRSDAIFNISRLGLLLRGLETGETHWLKMALEDRIHQPYRQELIPGYGGVKKATLEAGGYGMVISGAGPTLLALSPHSCVNSVIEAMKTAWEKEGVAAEVRSLLLDREGVKLLG